MSSSNEEDSFEEEEDLPKSRPIVRVSPHPLTLSPQAATQKMAPTKKHLPEQARPRVSEAPKASFPNRMQVRRTQPGPCRSTRVNQRAKESESEEEDDGEEDSGEEEDYESEDEDSEEDVSTFKLKPLDPSSDFNPDGTKKFQVRTKLMQKLQDVEEELSDADVDNSFGDQMSESIDEDEEEEDDEEEESCDDERDESEEEDEEEESTRRKTRRRVGKSIFEKMKEEENKPKKFRKNVMNVACTKYDIIKRVAKKMLGYRLKEYDEDHEGGFVNGEGNQKLSQDWDVSWHDLGITADFLTKMQPYQKVNQYPGMYVITRKNFLARNLMKMKRAFPAEYKFFPKTWIIPQETRYFRSQFESKNGKPAKKKTYIVKPEGLSQGQGIYLSRNCEKIIDNCTAEGGYIVQEYLDKPHLVDDLKYDLRIYVLLYGINPMRVYIHEQGIARFATEPYVQPKPSNLDNLYMHLTNYSINKMNSAFEQNKGGKCKGAVPGSDEESEDEEQGSDDEEESGHKRSLNAILKLLLAQGADPDRIMDEIKDIIVKTLIVGQPYMSHIYRSCQPEDMDNSMCFQILGFDIMIDRNFKPWLIEVNQSPSFATDSPLDYEVKKRVLKDSFNLLNVSQERRNEFIRQKQKQMADRILTGKQDKLDPEARQKLKEQKLEERFQFEMQQMRSGSGNNFEIIFPSLYDEEKNKKYEVYIKRANDIWDEFTTGAKGKKKIFDHTDTNDKMLKKKKPAKKEEPRKRADRRSIDHSEPSLKKQTTAKLAGGQKDASAASKEVARPRHSKAMEPTKDSSKEHEDLKSPNLTASQGGKNGQHLIQLDKFGDMGVGTGQKSRRDTDRVALDQYHSATVGQGTNFRQQVLKKRSTMDAQQFKETLETQPSPMVPQHVSTREGDFIGRSQNGGPPLHQVQKPFSIHTSNAKRINPNFNTGDAMRSTINQNNNSFSLGQPASLPGYQCQKDITRLISSGHSRALINGTATPIGAIGEVQKLGQHLTKAGEPLGNKMPMQKKQNTAQPASLNNTPHLGGRDRLMVDSSKIHLSKEAAAKQGIANMGFVTDINFGAKSHIEAPALQHSMNYQCQTSLNERAGHGLNQPGGLLHPDNFHMKSYDAKMIEANMLGNSVHHQTFHNQGFIPMKTPMKNNAHFHQTPQQKISSKLASQPSKASNSHNRVSKIDPSIGGQDTICSNLSNLPPYGQFIAAKSSTADGNGIKPTIEIQQPLLPHPANAQYYKKGFAQSKMLSASKDNSCSNIQLQKADIDDRELTQFRTDHQNQFKNYIRISYPAKQANTGDRNKGPQPGNEIPLKQRTLHGQSFKPQKHQSAQKGMKPYFPNQPSGGSGLSISSILNIPVSYNQKANQLIYQHQGAGNQQSRRLMGQQPKGSFGTPKYQHMKQATTQSIHFQGGARNLKQPSIQGRTMQNKVSQYPPPQGFKHGKTPSQVNNQQQATPLLVHLQRTTAPDYSDMVTRMKDSGEAKNTSSLKQQLVAVGGQSNVLINPQNSTYYIPKGTNFNPNRRTQN